MRQVLRWDSRRADIGSTLAFLAIALVPALCAFAAHAQDDDGARWRWPVERVTETVTAVRAGRGLQPETWPGGARVAVLLSFDVDTETIPLIYYDTTPDLLSRGEFGARVGLGRVLTVLDRHALPASFFIPAISAILHPQILPAIAASGRHEIGVHGWIHETPADLDLDSERRLLQHAVSYLENQTGQRPIGYRAPSWSFSVNTLALIRELGFLYDSSLMADDRPYELVSAGEPTGIVELPVDWILDDWPFLHVDEASGQNTPREILQVWLDEFEAAYRDGSMFLLTMHPQVIGRRSRIVMLERLIEHIRGRDDVWFATHAAAARYVAEQAKLETAIDR